MAAFLQRFRVVCGNLHTQDVIECTVMIAVILLLVIGAFKLNGGTQRAKIPSMPAASAK